MRDRRIVPLLVVAAGLVLLCVGFALRSFGGGSGSHRGMTAGTITARGGSGTSLDLTVRYTVDGRAREVKGTVDRDQFAWQGGNVWVCYAEKDPSQASLRLPYDPWCNQK